MTPRRAHKARAQGLRAAVSLTSAALAQAARALRRRPAAADVRFADSPATLAFSRARSTAEDLLSLLLSRDPKFREISRFWVSLSIHALKVF